MVFTERLNIWQKIHLIKEIPKFDMFISDGNIFTIMLIGIECFIYMSHPFQYVNKITVRNCYVIVNFGGIDLLYLPWRLILQT